MDYATPNPEPLKKDETDPTETPQVPGKDIKSIATEKAKLAAQDVQEKAVQLKEVASEKAQQFKSYAELRAGEIKTEAVEKAQAVKQVASDQYERSVTRVKGAHEETEDYIRKNPTKSVLAAFGAGLLIGLLARRR
ncbi:DUF883 family protein [Rubritalea marina]|uniref:DUF883 family protein n=1 Tax=Rubritalea marina TaxID=361055 RepID=UPI000367F505|nr:DUF883 family protein [Rubritalea marina]